MKISISNNYVKFRDATVYLTPNVDGVEHYDSFNNTYSVYLESLEFKVYCNKQLNDCFTKDWQTIQRNRAIRIANNLFNKYFEA